MRKKKFVIANWKMHPVTPSQAHDLFDAVKRRVARARRVEVVLCPPTLFLGSITQSYGGTSLSFGAQDVSLHKKEGSHTGEVSGAMLRGAGISYAIIGHSERRAMGETNEHVNKKVHAALEEKLYPIVCVGEEIRDSRGKYLAFVEEEIRESLEGVSKKQSKNVLIAYEPIWAIGKKAEDAITPHDAHEMALFIRKILVKMYGRKEGFKIPILYGGSVEPSNAEELITAGGINGFLVGHASLDDDDFVEIVKVVNDTK